MSMSPIFAPSRRGGSVVSPPLRGTQDVFLVYATMRARGSGRVFRPMYKGKEGQWVQAKTWAISYYNRRKRGPESEYGFSTRAAAEGQLRARLTDQDRGVLTGRSIERVAWEDLATLITDEYAVNKRKTPARLRQCLVHLRKVFGLDRAVDVTTDRIVAYTRARLEDGAAPATVNRELSALKRMFSIAAKAKAVSRDTVPYIPMLAEHNVRKGFFEEHQFLAVLRHLPVELQRVVTVAYATGWRVPSEILTRQWQHVDLQEGWLRLEPGETKNTDGRMFPIDLDPRLRAALTEARADTVALESTGRIVPWVFHWNGRRIQSFRKRWLRACRAAGVPGRLQHDFRRTAYRNLLRAGVPETMAMAVTGHKTRSMATRYTIVDEGMLREVAAKVRVARGGRNG